MTVLLSQHSCQFSSNAFSHSLPIWALSGNLESCMSKESHHLFFQPKILLRNVFSQSTQIVNYLHKANVKDALYSKNKCLTHVCSCEDLYWGFAVSWMMGREVNETYPAPEDLLKLTGQRWNWQLWIMRLVLEMCSRFWCSFFSGT